MKEFSFELDHQDISSYRLKCLKRVKESEYFANMIFEYGLDDNFILENTSKFIKVLDSLKTCEGCKSLKSCPKKLRGIKEELRIDDERYASIIYVPCLYNVNQLKYDKKYFIKDFNEDFLSYDFKEIGNVDYRNVRLKITNRITEIVQMNDSIGVYLHGSRRCGKTFMLALTTKALIDKYDYNVAFLDSQTNINELKEYSISSKEEFAQTMETLSNIDVLVFDDFGSEFKSEYTRDTILIPLLNKRLRNDKLTMFTSSFSLEEIRSMYSLKDKFSPNAKMLVNIIESLTKVIEIESQPFRK